MIKFLLMFSMLYSCGKPQIYPKETKSDGCSYQPSMNPELAPYIQIVESVINSSGVTELPTDQLKQVTYFHYSTMAEMQKIANSEASILGLNHSFKCGNRHYYNLYILNHDQNNGIYGWAPHSDKMRMVVYHEIMHIYYKHTWTPGLMFRSIGDSGDPEAMLSESISDPGYRSEALKRVE